MSKETLPIVTAESLGEKAFKEGRFSAPCQNPEFMDLLKLTTTGKIGSSLPILKAPATDND